MFYLRNCLYANCCLRGIKHSDPSSHTSTPYHCLTHFTYLLIEQNIYPVVLLYMSRSLMHCFVNYLHTEEVCNLQMDPGSCFARIVKFYYDKEEKACRLFLYGGCQGNGNHFETKEDCEQMCRGQVSLLPHYLIQYAEVLLPFFIIYKRPLRSLY